MGNSACAHNRRLHRLSSVPGKYSAWGPMENGGSRKIDNLAMAREAGKLSFPKVLRGVFSWPATFRFNKTLIIKRAGTG